MMKTILLAMTSFFLVACGKGDLPVVGLAKSGQEKQFVSSEGLKEVLIHSLVESSEAAKDELDNNAELEAKTIVIGLSLESDFGGAPVGVGLKNVYEFHYEEVQ